MSIPVFIPIAGGKGGVGKSLLAANIAIGLAEAGRSTTVVDLDLGASSLFAFLGLPNRYPGIGDFVRAKRGKLGDMLVPTSVSNLRFLPGDGRSPFMANIGHGQKAKLLRGLRSLESEYVVLDLGSGSTYNTLDYFALGKTGIVVTTPDHPSILKMLTFLKNFLLRRIEEALGHNTYAKAQLRVIYDQPLESQFSSMASLYEHLSAEAPDAADYVSRICREFRPRIVFNMGSQLEDLAFTEQIDASLGSVLGIEADYFGYLFWDKAIPESVQARLPFLSGHATSFASQEIRRIVQRILRFWDVAIPNSADLLLGRVRQAMKSAQTNEDPGVEQRSAL